MLLFLALRGIGSSSNALHSAAATIHAPTLGYMAPPALRYPRTRRSLIILRLQAWHRITVVVYLKIYAIAVHGEPQRWQDFAL